MTHERGGFGSVLGDQGTGITGPAAPRARCSLIDISASTMANIGPAYSFYFGFAFLVADRGRRGPADDHRGRHRDRPAGQHAGTVLPGAPVHRRLHLVRGQDIRRDERRDDRAAVRGGVHHRDLVGARGLRRVRVDHAAVLLQLERAVGHLLGDPHRRRDHDDGPRRGRVDQAGRACSSASRCWCWSWCRSRRSSSTAATCRRCRSSPATSPTASAAWRPGSRWPSTCSSAGRTRPRWPRRPATRGGTCRGRCSCRSR